ncbi:MAG: hypothetical protein IPL25_13385 [Saprospiraceae bacterium]|nr:hypothetical protein [Candidatus Vicinibacter affinis]
MKKVFSNLVLAPLAIQAQEQWSLVKCIRQAQQENLTFTIREGQRIQRGNQSEGKQIQEVAGPER